ALALVGVQISFWLAYMHLLLMLCPNTKFLTPSGSTSTLPFFVTINPLRAHSATAKMETA
ncbi:hypothetical protein ACIPZG_22355, partial [Pseudomonas sp. NPDC089395]|uniref:hypothetical protein n=1 Tax=Pseudomonas sp. NPDC089395 TaxID=3364460 RepID=UPI003805394F